MKKERHGMSHRPEYAIWEAIVQRCTNPKNGNYKRYGGRGIAMHPAWRRSFKAFFAHIGPRPHKDLTIERIKNGLGYVPGNVRWATYAEQNRNRRGNRLLRWKGRDWIIADLARANGMSPPTLHKRLAKGMSLKRALVAPLRNCGRRAQNIAMGRLPHDRYPNDPKARQQCGN